MRYHLILPCAVLGLLMVGCAATTDSDPVPVASATPVPKTAAEIAAEKALAAKNAARQAAQERENERVRRKRIAAEKAAEAAEAREAAAKAKRLAAYEDSIAMREGDLVLLRGYEAKNEEYSTKIEGVIVNESDSPLSYAEVKFSVTDKSGASIESPMDNITYVAPHAKWKFSCLVMTDDSFRFRPVSMESRRAD